jgi:hypothetical protein
MSIVAMILGESGTGKTASLRELNPQDVLLIQAIPKPLPFRVKGWTVCNKDNPAGSIWATDNTAQIIKGMHSTSKPIIVIDDFQYTMSNEFMRRILEKVSGSGAFDKFNEIAHAAWSLLTESSKLEPWKRVYILSHTDGDDQGRTRAKTIGKLLNDKITVEGLVTMVLRTQAINNNYVFSTQNDGFDTTKSPMGMFEQLHIPNDLSAVDAAICSYYELTQPQ